MENSPPRREDKDIYMALDYKIVFEDDFLLVVNKPAPLPVHPVSRFRELNLLTLLEKEVGQKLYLVNRLDSETSGLILIAKGAEIAGELGEQYQKRKVAKEYQAIVFGIPEEKKGEISIGLRSEKKDYCYMHIPDPEGKYAETHYETLKEYKGFSLLKLKPISGRTHQLRVHLKHIGHPIVGDKIYVDLNIYNQYVHEGWQESMAEVVKLPRLALHSSKLEFDHPQDQERLSFIAELPEMMRDFLKEL